MYVLNHALIWLMQQDPTDKFVKTVSDWVLGKMPAFLGNEISQLCAKMSRIARGVSA